MKFLYDWSNYPNIMDYFMSVYFNSLNVLNCKHKDIKMANEFMNDMEEYFMYMINHGYDINLIYNKISSLLYISSFINKPIIANNITYLRQEPVILGDRFISLNEDIGGNVRLTARERRKLYLYKGLTQYIFNYNDNRIHEFSDAFNSDDEGKKLVNSGWILIRDILSQELAERIIYEISSKKRSGNRIGLESNYYPISGNLIVSRLEDDRPFEELIVSFGTTLSGIGTMFDYSHDKIMNDLIDRTLTTNLPDSIISQYIYNGFGLELNNMLHLMGLLVNEKYATYGKRIIKDIILSEKEVTNIYNKIIDECQKLFTLDDDIYEGVPIINNIIRIKNR